MKRPSYRQLERRPGQGIEKLLGELEAEIMDLLWEENRPLRVRDVLVKINADRDRPVAYTTVMTVMARLAEKGLLDRTLIRNTHHYQVSQSRDGFLRRASERIVQELVTDFGEVAIASFLQAIGRVDPERLRRLRTYLNDEVERQ